MPSFREQLAANQRLPVNHPHRLSSMKVRDLLKNRKEEDEDSDHFFTKEISDPFADFFNDREPPGGSRIPRIASGDGVVVEHDSQGNMTVRQENVGSRELPQDNPSAVLQSPFAIVDASTSSEAKIMISNAPFFILETGGAPAITNLDTAIAVVSGDHVYAEWTISGSSVTFKAGTLPNAATFSGSTQLTANHSLGEIYTVSSDPEVANFQGASLYGGLRAVQRINTALTLMDFLYDGKYAQLMFPYGN